MSIILVKGSTRACPTLSRPCLVPISSRPREKKQTLNISKQNIKQLSAKDRKLN